MITSVLLSAKIMSSHLVFAATQQCGGGNLLGLPKWYEYLDTRLVDIDGDPSTVAKVCSVSMSGINDIWLIALAIVDILLRVAVLVAIIFVIVGAIKFITSRGETGGPQKPNKINQARNTVIDGLVGLVIAVVASAVVGYVARSFSG